MSRVKWQMKNGSIVAMDDDNFRTAYGRKPKPTDVRAYAMFAGCNGKRIVSRLEGALADAVETAAGEATRRLGGAMDYIGILEVRDV